MHKDVYKEFPILENENFLLRAIDKDADTQALLRVYSDTKAVALFNSDNCNGDTFYYETLERMQQAVDFWLFSYEQGYFVRWAVVDKQSTEPIGTIEAFRRDAKNDLNPDAFNQYAILRLDLRSDWEKKDKIICILELIVPQLPELFGCIGVATKAIPQAEERRAALEIAGFHPTNNQMIGNDKTAYGDYYCKTYN